MKTKDKPTKGQLDTIRRTEYLIDSAGLSYYLTHDFYDILIAHASMQEDKSNPDGYGFSMYIYDTADLFNGSFKAVATGLGGFGGIISNVVRWIDGRMGSDYAAKLAEAGNLHTVDSEIDDMPVILQNLTVFSEAWDAFSDTTQANGKWYSIHFKYYEDSKNIPDDLDWGLLEFKGCNHYPYSMKDMFAAEAERMKEAIEDGPWPECPECNEDDEDDD